MLCGAPTATTTGSDRARPRIPSDDNSFCIDVDAYDLVIDASTGSLPIEATSDIDSVRPAVLALAVEGE